MAEKSYINMACVVCVFKHTFTHISFCSLKVVFGITVWLCRQNWNRSTQWCQLSTHWHEHANTQALSVGLVIEVLGAKCSEQKEKSSIFFSNQKSEFVGVFVNTKVFSIAIFEMLKFIVYIERSTFYLFVGWTGAVVNSANFMGFGCGMVP